MNTPCRRPLVIAVMVSFLFLVGSAWIRGGVGATPYDTLDSQGQKMGFNYVPTAEHYRIIFRNANWRGAIAQMEGHDWWLAAGQGLILFLIFTISPRPLKFVLWLQLAFFYWGLFGLYVTPLAVADVLFLHMSDREGFVDFPYISVVSQGAWWWSCFFMLWKLRRPSVFLAAHPKRARICSLNFASK
ncbi:MAG TPA: hypothetical protein VG796_06800 [Verrucomicrobiales bacterium]|jgi:hypothetical protein|nr:hypothetical protein [Verrucomicrobiales bacterium]